MEKRFKLPIPKGYRIYYPEMSVAGTSFRLKNVRKAFSARSVVLILIPEPTNKFDLNAIKVVAKTKKWFLDWEYHIGYVPSEIAEDIKDKKIDALTPRLKKVWIGNRGGCSIIIDLLGLKSAYADYGPLRKPSE